MGLLQITGAIIIACSTCMLTVAIMIVAIVTDSDHHFFTSLVTPWLPLDFLTILHVVRLVYIFVYSATYMYMYMYSGSFPVCCDMYLYL